MMPPPAWLEKWEPAHNFIGAVFHRSCWMNWPFRQGLIGSVNNSPRSGYRMNEDGTWEFLGKDRT